MASRSLFHKEEVPEKPESSFADRMYLFLILLVAFGLRSWGLDDFSFSNDELSAIHRLQFDSFAQLIQEGVKEDGHPALTQVFLYYWSGLFGETEASLRFPFVIFGTLAVFFFFRFGQLWIGNKGSLLGASLLAVLEFPLLYSQIARPYGMGLCFILLFAWAWSLMVKGKGGWTWRRAIFMGVAGALCLYTHYFCALTALLLGIFGLLLLNGKNFAGYLLAAALSLILFLPHIPITLRDLSYGGVGEWLSAPEPGFFYEHLLYIFNGSLIVTAVVLATALLGLFTPRKRGDSSGTIVWGFLVLFLLVIGIGYYYSVNYNPVLQDSVLIFSMPFLLLFLLAGFPNEMESKLFGVLVFLFLAGGAFHSIGVNRYYQKEHFGVFKELAETTLSWEKEFGKENITKAVSLNAPFYIHHYLDRMEGDTRFELYNTEDDQGKKELVELVRNSETPYFLYGWSTVHDDPLVYEVIREEYPFAMRDKRFFNSRISLFSRKGGDERNVYFEWEEDFDDRVLSSEKPLDTNKFSSDHTSSPYGRIINGGEVYGPGFGSPISEVFPGDPLSCLVAGSVRIQHPEMNSGATLVLSLKSQDSTLAWKGGGEKVFSAGREKGDWYTLHVVMPIPEQVDKDSQLNFYVWNKEKRSFIIDDLQLKVVEWVDLQNRKAYERWKSE